MKHCFLSFFLFLFLLPVMALADLNVHFMNINRNDGILIECDGEAAFLDAGIYEYGAQAIDYMNSVGVTKLKYYIGTHAHADHVGAGAPIILAMQPDAVLQSHDDVKRMIASRAQTPEESEAVQNTRFVTVRPGEVYSIGGASLAVLGPLTLRDNDKDHEYENENSLVCMLTFGNHSFLLTGDAPGTALREIEAASPGSLRCDVLKNPHHNGPLESDVLAMITPTYVIYSTSDEVPPTSLALLAAAQAGAVSLITSPKQNGTIIFYTDGSAFTFETENAPESASFAKESIELYAGQRTANRVRVNPSCYKAITYFSSDSSVAQVDENGSITAVSSGSAVISAIAGGTIRVECPVTVKPVEPVLNRSSLTLTSGGHDQLKVSFLPKNASEKITWESDAPATAAVENGKITAGQPGETIIRAKLENGTEACCVITVKPLLAKSVSLTPPSLTLTVGESACVTATVSPKNVSDPHVTWTSADENIASVGTDGTVTAHSAGKVRITAEASGGKKASLFVTVKEK